MRWLARLDVWEGMAAALGVLLGLASLMTKAIKRYRRWRKFQEAIIGERAEDMPPGQEHRPGLLERMTTLEKLALVAAEKAEATDAGNVEILRVLNEHGSRLSTVEGLTARLDQAMRPNGGSSVADQINRIAKAVVPGEDQRRPAS